ncbi:MAG: hypothetical protein FWD90_01630 [Defluviitaleaceae bacterium]|nr:hypothetical protein [Defluviitaleaceae bacterium]
MVKAELNYNPYLLETSVMFNGNEPKINSMVEKYISGKLQNWILILPDIFCKEMNGWEFVFDFSGTKIDFESLQEVFNKACAGKGSVFLFHKNELESVEQKKQRITDLLTWFNDNRNRKFDYNSFKETNTLLFDDKCSLIVVQGTFASSDTGGIVIENVNDVNELKHASLENTPILFFVNEANHYQFKANLHSILKRKDITSEQLFFHLDSALSYSKMQRIISESGVSNPQIISDSVEHALAKYFEVYPMTAYIQRVIGVLQAFQYDLDNVLQAEGEQNISINSGIRQKIDSLDVIISKLKKAAEQIIHRDNFDTPDVFNAIMNEFMAKIANWNKKKIKINSDEEAGSKAVEFQKELGNFFNEFTRQIAQEFHAMSANIRQTFAEAYATAEFGDDYVANQAVHIDLAAFELPTIIEKLLEFRNVSMVEQADILGDIKGLFGAVKQPKELKQVIEYKYDDWRSHAMNTAAPILAEVMNTAFNTLKDLYNRVAEDYSEHLKMQIKQQTQSKDEVSAQLSDDERLFQADIDWFNIFQEKLREVERG